MQGGLAHVQHCNLNRKVFLLCSYLCRGYKISFTVTIALSMCQAALRVLHIFTDLILKTSIRSRSLIPIL